MTPEVLNKFGGPLNKIGEKFEGTVEHLKKSFPGIL